MNGAFVTVDLKETALVIECEVCHSALELVNPRDGALSKNEHIRCRSCNAVLIPKGSPRQLVVAVYYELLNTARAADLPEVGHGQIRIRVPVGPLVVSNVSQGPARPHG